MCPRVGGGNVRSQAPPRPLVQPLCAMVTPEEACQFDLHQTPTQFISFWTIYAIPMSKCPIASYIIFVCFNFLLPLILFKCSRNFAIPGIKVLVSSLFQSLLVILLSSSYSILWCSVFYPCPPPAVLSLPPPPIILVRPCWWQGGGLWSEYEVSSADSLLSPGYQLVRRAECASITADIIHKGWGRAHAAHLDCSCSWPVVFSDCVH